MPKQNAPLLAFNRGLVSKSALSRVDVERVRLSAETMTNWIPTTQGSMYLRPGLKFLGSSRSDGEAVWIDFVAATDDTALLEITDERMKVWIDDAAISRPSVSTSISNGSFAASTDWTDASTGGATLTFGGTGLVMDAVNRGGQAVCTREITVDAADEDIEHGLIIEVARGPVTFRCGSTSGGEQYVEETTLRTGSHYLAFTPTGNFHLEFSSDAQVDRIITSIAIEASGAVDIPAPWQGSQLSKLRWAQSADVVFVACEGVKQHRIERRGAGRSWSVVEYDVDDGPFTSVRTARHVRLKPGATYGNTTLTADRKFFKPTHVGALFRLFHSGYHGQFRLARDDTYTDPIRVTGVNEDNWNDRDWSYTISGTWSGTLRNYRSYDNVENGYTQFRRASGAATIDITGNATFDNLDTDDNAIVFYKVGFESGAYTSGAAVVDMDYDGGGDYGICRVTTYNSATSVDIEILKDFTGTTYTEDWREGLWSDRQGWPTSVAIYEGRLWWAGNVYIFGSVSDAFDSFDAEVEGDSGPIVRTLGSGPVDVVNWVLPLQRLVLGTAGAETTLKSSSFDEPLTPQAMGARDAETQGSAKVNAAKVGKRGVFVQRSKKRVFELIYSGDVLDYDAKELTLLCPDITGTATIVGVAVQRQPDTRLHFPLSDGTVAILTYEPKEDVLCWSKFETDGIVEQAVVLPGEEEDQVYYHVRRTIDGNTKRYLEKWALASECKGGTRNRQLDSYIEYTGTAVTTLTGLGHLAGETVAVWAAGQCLEDGSGDIRTFTVSAGGNVTLPSSMTNIVCGLQYTADYKSSKLAYAAALGTALTQKKRAARLGLVLGRVHYKGLKAGGDFTTMDNLPAVKDGADVAAHTVHTEYDEPMQSVPGQWTTDSRLCLRATAPRVCEVLAAIVQVDTNG